jgi:hypothetical protein
VDCLDSCFFTSVNIIMADQYTPEEIRAIFEEYNNAVKSGSPVTAEMTARMKDATAGIKNYTAQLNASLKSLGSSVLGIAKAMKDGEQGASVYNNSINAAADAVEAFASKFGFLGKIIGTLITAGARYAAEVNKQSDALFKSYKELSSSGLSDAGGMRTIFDNMQKFGYGIEQLGEMTALLKANSKELAAFGGTAASGTKAFADAAGQIQRSDVGKSLQMLGKTPDEINKGVAMFVKQQQGIGVSSANINQNLAQKSADYVKQLDLLSKLTGDSAEGLQAKLEDAQAEDAFAATQYELKKKALAGDLQADKQYKKNEELAQRLEGEARKEFIRGAGGDISAFSKTLLTAPGAVQAFLDPMKTADQALTTFGKEVKKNMDQTSGLAMLNASSDAYLGFAEQAKAASRYADQTAEQQKDRAKAEQELQQKGLEPSTKAQVEMRIEQMKTRDSLQSLINKGINPVTDAMKHLASGIETVTGKIPGTGTSTGTQMGGAGGPSGGFFSNLFGGGKKVSGDANQILETIKKRESGGNYQAQAKGSSASGAYQFIDSTWQAQTKKSGIGTEYKSAKDAPKEIQDAIAKQMVDDILKQAGGDVSKVPLAWYTGNIQGKMSEKALAANNGLTGEMYQQKWMAEYNKMGGATNITGPSGSYNSKTSGIKPDSTLPTASSSNALATNTESDTPSWLMSLNENLERQNRLQSEAVDALGRIRQNTAV